MQSLNLQIEDSFFLQFRAMIDSLVKEKKISIVDSEDEIPKSVMASSIEEVRQRVYEAEQQPSVSQDEYNRLMNEFFKEEVGISR